MPWGLPKAKKGIYPKISLILTHVMAVRILPCVARCAMANATPHLNKIVDFERRVPRVAARAGGGRAALSAPLHAR